VSIKLAQFSLRGI
jgi:hypothetical protein